MATVTRVPSAPVTPPDRVLIDLSVEEASRLKILCYWFELATNDSPEKGLFWKLADLRVPDPDRWDKGVPVRDSFRILD